MPKRGDVERSRELAPEAVAELGRALDRFCEATGRSRRRFASAVRLSPADLSPSHLQERALLLFWSLRRGELPRIAFRLALDQPGLRALEALAATVMEAVAGYPISPEAWREGRRETLDAGMLGVELFDQGHWGPAVSHLRYAWERLETLSDPADTSIWMVRQRVGAQLLNWLAYQNEAGTALRIARRLLEGGEANRSGNRAGLNALALTYKSIAVVCGHHPLTHPRTAIRHARAASRLLAEQELDRLCQAAALRDEAKAHLLWSRGGREEGPSPERREAAFATVEKAEAVLGPPSAETDAAFEWLQTRLTRLQFLGATGDAEGVDRVRAETFTRPWVCALLEGSENAALASRLAFVALAAPVASGDLDQVAYAARRFRTDPRSQPYADRVRRAAEMERAAAERDADGVRQAFLR